MSSTLSTLCDNELMFAETAIMFNFVFAGFFLVLFIYLFVRYPFKVCLFVLLSLLAFVGCALGRFACHKIY